MMPAAPKDARALIAVDLGAESCRVSLLRWVAGAPVVTLVHRFANAPRLSAGGLRWDLSMIEAGVDSGVRRCAAMAVEGVRSIAVDGWAVDYVRLGADGLAVADPFCYRDERTIFSEALLHERLSPERMRALTGVQLLRINTVYQLHAEADPGPWMNLPEYLLARWGGRRVAEYTNATHSQLVALGEQAWCGEIFRAAGLAVEDAPVLVAPGTVVGRLGGALAALPGMSEVALIAPACHDTASAIAGIPAAGEEWAYISSGTWSLVGTVLGAPCNHAAARADNFTNLGAVGGRVLFHKNVNGMWLIKQCMEAWGGRWTVPELVAAASERARPAALLDVDEPELLLAGGMPGRINAQLRARGWAELDEDDAAGFAGLIFHSLAARYAEVLGRVATHTGKRLRRLYVVGGASQNELLNRLTAEATGLEVVRAAAESSTVGNFAVQLAVLEGEATAAAVSGWAGVVGVGNAILPLRDGMTKRD